MPFDAAVESRATNLYFDRTFGCPAAKILPGEFYVTDRRMVLVTTLGSCVAACIRDPDLGIGGINHFMLPEATSLDPGAPVSPSARYGTYAMELLVNELVKLGARRNRLEAKVFGGGNVLGGMSVTCVGPRNASFVLGYLSLENIPVLSKDLVENYARKVYFFPDTGKVLVKKLRTVRNDTLVERETDYAKKLRFAPFSGDVELFE
ncbi:MAG: chemoreceptor glutamine deamidase CheD [Betaproteobacteria bacterium]